MAATAAASAAAYPSTGPIEGDLEDGNVSSPLSEVDDKDANDEEMERMHLDDHEGDNSSLSGEENQTAHNDNGSDSESALSEAASDVNSEANDTEAETLRLYHTPLNSRYRDVRYFTDEEFLAHAPSNLDKKRTSADDGSVSGDEVSIISSRADAEQSPVKTPVADGAHIDDDEVIDVPSDRKGKRKRTPVAEPIEPEEPPVRKRASSTILRQGAVEIVPPIEDDAISAIPQSGHQSPGDDEESQLNQDTTPEEDMTELESHVAKKILRGASKGKGIAMDSADEETPLEGDDEVPRISLEETQEHQDEEMGADAEEETAARDTEEMEKKQAAYRDWTHIEEMFGIFRDRLYKDRLQKLEEEEQSLQAAEPTHPEYLNMKQCLDDRLNQKLHAINKEYEFSLQAHDRRAIAERAQIWSQFMQAVRERREQALGGLNKQWYDVQSARRNAHSLPDYGLLFPKDPAQRVRNAIAYNTEVSSLAGLAKYEGFPAGPELKGASALELEADLALMERARRGRPKHSMNHMREEYQPPNLTRLGPAGEQFLKDTPWANPNHSAHKLQHQGASAETLLEPSASSSRTAHQSLSLAPESKAAFESSAPIIQRSPSLAARLPESPNMPRNMMHASSSHQMKRMGSIPSISRGSKAAAA